jgi:hypothetical protein
VPPGVWLAVQPGDRPSNGPSVPARQQGFGFPQRGFGRLEGDRAIVQIGAHAFLHAGAAHAGKPEQRHGEQQHQRHHKGHAALAGSVHGRGS